MESLSVTRRLLFPSPRPPHYDHDSFQEHLIWIPKQSPQQVDIPCLWLPYQRGDLLVLFSHGNGCDIGSMHDTMQYYHNHWRVNMLVWEYPGYGCCEGQSSESSINQNMRIVYEFATGVLNWPSERIILYGQSIGTGPVCWLASALNREKIHIGGVILQSPYTGIKDVVKYFAGTLASSLISNRWSNIDEVKHIIDPFLCIHGQLDQVIPYQHSERLYDACASPHKHLLLVHDATHNEFDHQQDIITPISLFFDQYFRKYQSHPESQDPGFVLPPTPSSTIPSTSHPSDPHPRKPLPELSRDQLDLRLDDFYFVVPQAVIDAARARQQAQAEKEQSSSVGNFFTNLISSTFKDTSANVDTDSKHAEYEYQTHTQPHDTKSKPKQTVQPTKTTTKPAPTARPASATSTTSSASAISSSTSSSLRRQPSSTRVEMVDMSKPDAPAPISAATTAPAPAAAAATRPTTAPSTSAPILTASRAQLVRAPSNDSDSVTSDDDPSEISPTRLRSDASSK